MKKSLLTITVISILFPSSTTQCLTDEQNLIMCVLGGVVALGAGIGIYVYHQNPSAASPEPHSETQIQHDQQSENKRKPKLIKDLRKSEDQTVLPETPQENRPSLEDAQESSFLSTLLDRIREKETPKHLDALLNDVAFEN